MDSPAAYKPGDVTSILSALPFPQVHHQGRQPRASGVGFVDETGRKPTACCHALFVSEIDGGQEPVVQLGVQGHGQDLDIGIQPLTRARHLLHVLKAQKGVRGQSCTDISGDNQEQEKIIRLTTRNMQPTARHIDCFKQTFPS